MRFIHGIYTGRCRHLLRQALGDALMLPDPDSITVFEDHCSYMPLDPAHRRMGDRSDGNGNPATAVAAKQLG